MVSYTENLKKQLAELNGLNPCCSGQWSRTFPDSVELTTRQMVLILVVVDNGLVPSNLLRFNGIYSCLNPCCSGQWSRTEHLEFAMLQWDLS